MLRFRQKWPDAAECCGREVQTNRLGRKKAWWAQGTAIEKFEEDIQPEIETFLKNADLNDGDIYFRIYMIGRTQEASRPTVMICCADVSIGRRAKESLRHSPVIRNNPGFCLGSIDFPLEQLVPVRGLALEVKPLGQVLNNASDPTAGIPIFAISDSATVGRRLFVTDPDTMEVYRHSTGGVVVANNGRFYQLTVGHIADLSDGALHPSRLDPDACSFDGQSDSDFGDDFSVFEQDLRRASVSVFNLSQSESSDAETEKTEANTVGYRSPANTDYTTTNSDPTGFSRNEGLKQLPMIEVGTIAVHSKDGDAPSLDYALVVIPPPSKVDQINRVLSSTGDDTRPIMIHNVTGVGREERRVIVITGSSGVVMGILVPGTTFLGRGNQKGSQKLYVVQLDGVVAEGDSGAAVVDEISGSLYGHMVSGCPGTRIAYIVAATDIFQALESELQGQVTIVSQKTIQKSPMQPSAMSSARNCSTDYAVQDRYSNGENSNLTLVTGDDHSSLQCGSWQRGNGPYTTSLLSLPSNCALEEPDQLPKYTTLDENHTSSSPSDVQGSIPKAAESLSIDGRPNAQVTARPDSVLDAQISNPDTKVESSATAFRNREQHGGYRRRKKAKKAVYRQGRRTCARQGAWIHRPYLRKFDSEPEGSTSFPSEEKSKINIRRAMEQENAMYMDGVESEEEDESLLSLLFEPFRDGRQISPEEGFIRTVYNCCSLRELQRAAGLNHSNKTCLLDDRTNDGTNSVSLGNYGPLSVRSLYLRLRKQRFCGPFESSPGLTRHESALHDQQALPLSADRRLIYIPDVDSYGIAVLIATASPLQTRALGNILYKYLEFQPGISASFQSHFFHVYFCLPTYVWRSTTTSPQDSRLKRTGESIRTVRDVSFLRTGSASKSHSGEVDYLCEAQVSVLITAIDSRIWTGYCFVDTYFHSQDRYQDYYSYYTEEDSIRLDPFSDGTIDADRPMLNPRDYFLCVLNSRAKGFQQEWQYVVLSVRRSIEEYVNAFALTSNTTSGERTDFNKSLDWIYETKHLLHLLTRCLKRTIHHWDNSRITENAYSSFSVTCLSEIQETFSDVKILVRDLEDLSSICDEHSRAVILNKIKLAMIDETVHFARFQTKAWKDIQTLKSLLLFLCYPTLLAAAMLSMSEKATPSFLGPNKLSFFILSTVLVSLALILGLVAHYWHWIHNSLCQLGKSIQVYMFDLERLPRSNSGKRGEIELVEV